MIRHNCNNNNDEMYFFHLPSVSAAPVRGYSMNTRYFQHLLATGKGFNRTVLVHKDQVTPEIVDMLRGQNGISWDGASSSPLSTTSKNTKIKNDTNDPLQIDIDDPLTIL